MTINFIKKIHQGKIDSDTHNKFVRYGKGTFEKEIFYIKMLAKQIQIQCGFEYNDTIFMLASQILEKDINISGVIASTSDIKTELLSFGIKPTKITGKKYTISKKMTPKEFKEFIDKFKSSSLLLNAKNDEISISVKKSVPKPGKLVEKFHNFKLPTKYFDIIKDEFLFDIDKTDFKTCEIKHTYVIEDIIIPKEFEKDALKARLNAIRKGIIRRDIDIDKTLISKEYKFEA